MDSVNDSPVCFYLRPNEHSRLVADLVDRRYFGQVAITTSLTGASGMGRTSLARAVCQDPRVEETFSDGIYWVRLGGRLSPLDLLSRIARLVSDLTGEPQGITDIAEAQAKLYQCIHQQKILIVLDDICDLETARPFFQVGPGGGVLMITLNDETLTGEALRTPVDIMVTDEAAGLLADGLPDGAPDCATALVELAGRLNEWPLLLMLTNGLLRSRLESGETLREAIRQTAGMLQRFGLQEVWSIAQPEARDQAIQAVVSACLERLDAADTERWSALAVFSPGESIPLAALSVLWDVDIAAAEDACARLARLALVEYSATRGAINLHPALHAFLVDRLRAGVLVDLHRRLLDGYAARLGERGAQGSEGAWASGPDDGYFFQHLAGHMIGANRQSDLIALLFDYDWLRAYLRCGSGPVERRCDLYGLLLDFEQALSIGLDQQAGDLRLVQEALRLSAPALARDPQQLGSQLSGRLLPFHSSNIIALLERIVQASDQTWLRPLSACFAVPGSAEVRTMTGHSDWITGLVLLPEGQYAISASLDGTLRWWDLPSGKNTRALSAHPDGVSAVVAAPDGLRVASTGWDGYVRVWDTINGEEVLAFPAHTEAIGALTITPDGQRVITGADDRLIRVWGIGSGEMTRELVGHGDLVRALAVTPDGRTLVSGSWDGTVRIWDLETSQQMHFLTGHHGWVRAVAVSLSGEVVISGGYDRTVRVWDLWTGEMQAAVENFPAPVFSIAVLPDDVHALCGCGDGTLAIVNLQTGSVERAYKGHTGGINSVAVTKEGRFAITAADDRTMRVWDLVSLETPSAEVPAAPVYAMAMLPDGKRSISGSWDGTLKIWDLSTGAEISSLPAHQGGVVALAVSPDGRIAVSGARDHMVKVWDLVAETELYALAGHQGEITAVSIASDASCAVSGSDDGVLIAWDLTTGQSIATFHGEEAIWSCLLAPDGKTVAASASSGKMYFLEIHRSAGT